MTLVNPFSVLLPELWINIRTHLVSPYDARDRLCLQRTCKAAYALDPGMSGLPSGMILAPAWHALYDTATLDSFMRRIRKWDDVLTTLKAVIDMHLLDKPWFVPPRALEIKDYTDGLIYGNYWSVRVLWDLGAGISLVLECDPYRRGTSGWNLKMVVPPSLFIALTSTMSIESSSLQALLSKCPRLGFGMSTDVIQERAADNDLEALFVRRDHRNK